MQNSYPLIFGITTLVVIILLITFINIRLYLQAKRLLKSLQTERALLLKNMEEMDTVERRLAIIKQEICRNEERLKYLERGLVGIPLKAVLLLFKPSDN
ncbi:DUF4349 domain-containing protein [Adhaeribacter radiodurans]|uniref:Uncharacterized protein n=1 Tax=Adhaeribacter radiodurans TaxID=2745197 RepID=A0A7L7L4J4_9BACT|nr:hypothetical protein [Adhaeribacter radiodurans]QMU27700.1 hypothetical protein HUW48_06405 [Adhaeribacter radiodurans]